MSCEVGALFDPFSQSSDLVFGKRLAKLGGRHPLILVRTRHAANQFAGLRFARHDRKLVAYLSDCSDVPAEIAENIRGVEVLIIDALRHKPHPTHLSVDQAIEVARRVKPGKTYFTHICHELPQSEESQLPANTFIAYDGLRLEF